MKTMTDEEKQAARARVRVAVGNAKKVLKPGDRLRVTKCPGTKRTIIFAGWDGDWIVSKSGINDYAAMCVDRVNGSALADWLDEEVPVEWLADLLALIFETPNLDWLLLTKRPENFFARLNAAWRSRVAEDVPWSHRMVSWGERGIAPSNVWIGTTVENQEYAERRIPELLEIPAAVRFLSVEPMLGPVDLLSLEAPRAGRSPALRRHVLTQIDWVICGGESGPGRRPFEVEWAESLAAQCRTAGVPFFMKQDGHARSGQQGRIPSALWAREEWPVSISISPGEPAARRGAGAPDAGAPDLKDQNQRATERGPCGSAPGGIEHEAAKGTKPEGGAE